MATALAFANVNNTVYQRVLAELHLELVANSVVMTFFFALAAKEIKEAIVSENGALHDIRSAINPIIATAGGMIGPALICWCLVKLLYGAEPALSKLWAVPIATDIALSLFVAKRVFGGTSHPAVVFLLTLAILDDAGGLLVLAIMFQNPNHPVQPLFLGLVVLAVLMGVSMKRLGVRKWQHFIIGPGLISWAGMDYAGLHPSLSLVPIVLFCMPAGKRDPGIGVEASGHELHKHSEYRSPLEYMEHATKLPVEYGLGIFAFANAGVQFTGINTVTWIVLASLIIGKTGVIFLFSRIASIFFPLPAGMGNRDLLAMSYIASIGFTVSLFMASQAIPHASEFAGATKMGALLSGVTLLVGSTIGRAIRK